MSIVNRAARRIARISIRSNRPIVSSTAAFSTSIGTQSRSSSSRYLTAAAFDALGLGAIAVYSTQTASMDNTKTEPQGGLNPNAFVSLKLKSVEPYNYNTKVYHFALPDPNTALDLPVSSAVVCKFIGEDGKPVIRPYTPIDAHVPGEVILLVKEYEKGIMSKHIANLKVGDSLDIKSVLSSKSYLLLLIHHFVLADSRRLLFV